MAVDLDHPMDALPDELLLLIFGGIEDAATLLDAVPLVCQRWRRVARDPRSWASATVWSGTAGDCCCSAQRVYRLRSGREDRLRSALDTVTAARALLRAPALRRVTLALQQKPGDCQHVAALLSALRRHRPTVCELAVICTGHRSAPDRAAERRNGMDHTITLLGWSRERVRALRLSSVKASASWWSFLWITLKRCERLERLDVDTCAPRFDDELAVPGSLSQLRKLSLSTIEPWGDGENALLAHLVAASTGSLRRLVFRSGCTANIRLSPAATLAIAQCRELRDVTLPLQDVSAVVGMPRLRCLRLIADHVFDSALLSMLESCVAALQDCEPLDGLRELSIWFDSDYYFETLQPEPIAGEAFKAVLLAAFACLGRLAANVTWLRLTGILRPGPLQDLLANLVQPMASLELAVLGTFPVQTLPLFVGKRALRRLSGQAVCVGSGEAAQVCECGGFAVTAFKHERSSVKASRLKSGCSNESDSDS